MFSSRLAFCCIIALHCTSSGASPVQETSALEGADLEYAAAERGARELYIVLSTPATPSSYVSDGVLYITIAGSSIVNTVTISDKPTHSARYVAPNGRLSITIRGSSNQNRVNYNGTPYQPAVDFLSISMVGSSSRNTVNVNGSSVTASGSLRISIEGSSGVNSVTVNDPSLRPADARLQISITGSSNQNRVTINGSPRLLL